MSVMQTYISQIAFLFAERMQKVVKGLKLPPEAVINLTKNIIA